MGVFLATETAIRASFLHAYLSNDRATGIAAVAAAAGFALCAVRTSVPAFAVLAVTQLVLHALRMRFLHRPYRQEIARRPFRRALSTARIVRWELAATAFAGALFLSIALGCVVAFTQTTDEFSRVLTLCLTLSNALGIIGRSFAIRRMVWVQLLALCIPFSAAMLLATDPWLWTIAGFAVPFALVTEQLTVRLRRDLVAVVHEREAARDTAERFSATLEAIPDLVIHLDPDGLARVANASAIALLPDLSGRTTFAEAVRRNSLFAAGEVSRLLRFVETARERVAAETFGTGDGRLLDVSVSRPMETDTLIVIADVTERERALAAIVTMAREDHLTGLMSRAWFMESATARLAQRADGCGAALAVLDVDGFKQLNDELGHHAGDAALRVLSSVIAEICGRDVIATRHGSDEFAILSVGDANHLEAFRIDVAGVIAEFTARYREAPVRLSASAGVSLECASIDTLMATADVALLEARKTGSRNGHGGTIHTYDDTLRERTQKRERMKELLVAAVRSGDGIVLAYQPIVDPRAARVVGAEALCRWHHPELGQVPPPVFIELAEELGIIRDLTDIVLRRATADCAVWPEQLTVSVNLSAIDLEANDLERRVADALARAGLAPHRLQLEITESRAIRNDDVTRRLLERFAELGIGLALDDFGTGFSNLATVASLPLTTLKIDRSLVRTIDESQGFLLLSGAVTMFARMGLRVVVEGIETEEQLDLLATTGERALVQGYFFGRPMPVEQLVALAARGSVGPALRKVSAA